MSNHSGPEHIAPDDQHCEALVKGTGNEFYTCWLYATSITADNEPTDDDMKFIEGVIDEIEKYYNKLVAKASVDTSGKKPN